MSHTNINASMHTHTPSLSFNFSSTVENTPSPWQQLLPSYPMSDHITPTAALQWYQATVLVARVLAILRSYRFQVSVSWCSHGDCLMETVDGVLMFVSRGVWSNARPRHPTLLPLERAPLPTSHPNSHRDKKRERWVSDCVTWVSACGRSSESEIEDRDRARSDKREKEARRS